MSRSVLDDELLGELGMAAESVGCQLLHTELVGNTVRVILDHPEGVTLEHCTSVSRQASVLFDAADYGTNRYVLEVSSPGLDRELYSKDDYGKFAGKLVKMTFRTPEGSKRTVIGTLSAFDPENDQAVELVDRDSGETVRSAYDRIERTKLEIDL